MRANDVITPVRELLNDEDPEHFWSEPFLRARLNTGILVLRGRRPEAKLDDDDGDAVAYSTADSPTATLCASDHWKPHLIEYVLWQAYARDRKDSGHQTKAASHQAAWNELLVTA